MGHNQIPDEQPDVGEDMSVGTYSGFRVMLLDLINQGCMENQSDTPDFILADYLLGCLKSFDRAVNARRDWPSTENTREWIDKINA